MISIIETFMQIQQNQVSSRMAGNANYEMYDLNSEGDNRLSSCSCVIDFYRGRRRTRSTAQIMCQMHDNSISFQ